MKRIILLLVSVISLLQITAQKKIQTLQPSKLGIFKNGTCFVKREGLVTVSEKTFFIQAPDKVLMGTYWLFTGKEAQPQSILVKTDTFKTNQKAILLDDFLQASVGQNITLYGNASNTDLRKLSGKLLAYDSESSTLRVVVAAGKVVVTKSTEFEWLETKDDKPAFFKTDSIIPVAKVKLNKAVDQVWASTISLEKGIQWVPSYLFSVINEKEARLEMKATIVNSETDYLNMPVDIIIGNPEMFYGQALDPICVQYLNESLLGNVRLRGENSFNYSNVATQSVSRVYSADTYAYNNDDPGKSGQKTEDLYYYQLGVLDLEKNARVVVPVMATNIAYSEIYTTDLPLNSTALEGANAIQTYHSYLVNNNSLAPLTSGAVLVMNKDGQPLAQAQLNYTPVKSSSDLQLSKAVDVQVRNEEEESGREKSTVKRTSGGNYEKVTHSGTISITNYKDRKITIRVKKKVEGVFINADNSGKSRKLKTSDDDDIAELYWEVEVAAGARQQLKYSYYVIE